MELLFRGLIVGKFCDENTVRRNRLYLEHGMFNRALLLTSYDADLVLMFQSATAEEAKLPPGFATYFPKPVLGIVSKTGCV